MKLSIITVNLNNAEGLRKTIESVISQTYTDYEYLIIDGGSTDGSVEIINEFADKITYWVSEIDKGIYNAMNKGILKAKGEYCLFLNSGDWFLGEDVVKSVFSNGHSKDLICCKLFRHEKYSGGIIQLPKDKLTFYDFYTSSLSHPSTFIKTKLFHEIGLYDETLQIVADWKFFMEAVIIHRCSYMSLDMELTYCTPGGVSTSNLKVSIKERENVLNKLFSPFIEDYKILQVYRFSRVVKLWEKLKSNKIILSIYKFLVR